MNHLFSRRGKEKAWCQHKLFNKNAEWLWPHSRRCCWGRQKPLIRMGCLSWFEVSELASKLHPDEHTPEVTRMATIEQQNTHLACRLLAQVDCWRWPDWAPVFCNGVNDQPHHHWAFKANISTKIQSISAQVSSKKPKYLQLFLGPWKGAINTWSAPPPMRSE